MPERVCDHDTKALQCCKLTMAQINKLHTTFYAHPNKQKQDALILKFCSIVPVKLRPGFKGKRETSIKYAVHIDKRKVPICQKFFLKIFDITKHRVAYVMRRFFFVGEFADERRGGNHKENKFKEQKQSIHNFIHLQCVETHYCRKTKHTERKYLPSDLNLSKLYDVYKRSEYSLPNVKKSYFRNIFNNYYNIGFGSPQTDVCSKCLELSGRIKHETDVSKKSKYSYN